MSLQSYFTLNPVKVSLQEFLQDGSFGAIKLDASRKAVEQAIDLPPDWDAGAQHPHTASIWKYGDLEFHFENDMLTMIFMDDFDVPHGGRQINVAPWIINKQLTSSQAEQRLTTARVSYRQKPFPYAENGLHITTSAGTVLAFSAEGKDPPTLHALFCRSTY